MDSGAVEVIDSKPVHRAFVDVITLPKQNDSGYVWMQLKQHVTGTWAIVYDADRIQQPDSRLFDPEYWRAEKSIVGHAKGRGDALMLQTPFGAAVLRPFLRGGFAASLSRDRYLFLGNARSRPFAEAEILAALAEMGLPVPKVLGAICERHGMLYSGALLTLRIPGAEPLADSLSKVPESDPLWPAVGKCIRQFHAAGVRHADLNVRNILVDAERKVWLIDFDRAKMVRPSSVSLASNLNRLKRSIIKEKLLDESGLERYWSRIMMGYNLENRTEGNPGVEEKTP